jgi:hypothetical protein
MQLEERDDALARLGRHLRGLQCGVERRHHVELAAAGDLRDARDVDRSQLDGRARQRADHGARVARIGQDAQPGQQVADLGALEERGRADHRVGHARSSSATAICWPSVLTERTSTHTSSGRDVFARDQPLDVGGDGLGLGALGRALPERHGPRPAESHVELHDCGVGPFGRKSETFLAAAPR